MTAIQPLTAPPSETTDEEIVVRVLAGDRDRFELLLRRHNQRIYRAVRAVLRNPDDAEDVMQQAYINAYRNLGQFEGRASFATWMTRIAVREAIARNRKPALVQENDMVEVVEPGADPEQRAVAADLMQHVEAAVSALPEAYRSVLLLREVEGLSTDDTAASLDISSDVVKTRLHRARTMLRDALYRRAGVGMKTIFQFGAERCDRVVAAVMAEIGRINHRVTEYTE